MNGLRLAELADQMKMHGDGLHAGRVMELERKLTDGRLHIAFCGHFSAGKSTLINRLCGHKLLPSSPIPTSANVVTIRNGEPEALVTRQSEAGAPHRIPLEQLDEYCKNGEEIASVDIRYPIPWMGDRAVLLDTPGVDSTDEAHMRATESALHMADVIFFVMDYNHVLSEINFAFTKRLNEWGKPLYLIVNQIDKHRENEIPFADYAAGVVQAFRDWQVRFDGVLFVTSREPDHPHQEWQKLEWLLDRLLARSNNIAASGAALSAARLIEEHMGTIRERHEEEREALRSQVSVEEGERLSRRAAELLAQADELLRQPERTAERRIREVSSILENANVIPAATRDLAHEYLQSRKPGFKVGFLSSASKTAKEIERRLAAFQADFAEQVQAKIEWHVNDYLKKEAEAAGLTDELGSEHLALCLAVTPVWLSGLVSLGAGFTGEYTLNYSKQIAAEIKSLFRREAVSLFETMRSAEEKRAEMEAARLRQEIERLEREQGAYRRLMELEAEESGYRQSLLAFISQAADGQGVPDPSSALPDWSAYVPVVSKAGLNRPEAAHVYAGGTRADAATAAGSASAQVSGGSGSEYAEAASQPVGRRAAEAGHAGLDASPTGNSPSAGGAVEGVDDHEQAAPQADEFSSPAAGQRQRLERTAAKLLEAANMLQDQPSFRSVVRSLRDKAERLAHNRFTIALFGAFSAGKSSFANALIGQRLLPVSPNPTTAAINTIVPPAEGTPNGMAQVRMKTKGDLLEEVGFSLRMLGSEADVRGGLPDLSGVLAADKVPAAGKPHYLFLKAVREGWAEAEPRFGTTITVGMDEFADYVAVERYSCFVDSVGLAHDNTLTQQGVVLVDTPGADSINARHTGVAFNYMKNADAILFVTYYNHAFSQADREFLLQIGRVKDALEMDKMFFIVNAADLASDDAELAEVVKHVDANLVRHGVRNARIYPVSSQQAVEAKLHGGRELLGQSGITAFESDFYRFVFEDLSGVAVQAARRELERSSEMLGDWIDGAKEGEETRKRKLGELGSSASVLTAAIAGRSADDLAAELEKEIRELLFYVKQRLTFRFGELYNYAFNPSSLTEDGRDIKKALWLCYQEWLRLLSYHLSQEVLATSLRVEQFLNKAVLKWYEKSCRDIAEQFPTFRAEPFDGFSYVTPDVDETVGAPEVDERFLQSRFKSARSFFEGDGKALLRTDLEAAAAPVTSDYVERHSERVAGHYAGQLQLKISELRERLLQSLEQHAEGLRDALEMKVDIEQLEGQRRKLAELAGSIG